MAPNPFFERRHGNPLEKLDVFLGDLLTALRRRSFICDGKSVRLCLICNLLRNHLKYGLNHQVMVVVFPPQKWGWSILVHKHKGGNHIVTYPISKVTA